MFTDLLHKQSIINNFETAHRGKLIPIIVENLNFLAHFSINELNSELVSTNTQFSTPRNNAVWIIT